MNSDCVKMTRSVLAYVVTAYVVVVLIGSQSVITRGKLDSQAVTVAGEQYCSPATVTAYKGF